MTSLFSRIRHTAWSFSLPPPLSQAAFILPSALLVICRLRPPALCHASAPEIFLTVIMLSKPQTFEVVVAVGITARSSQPLTFIVYQSIASRSTWDHPVPEPGSVSRPGRSSSSAVKPSRRLLKSCLMVKLIPHQPEGISPVVMRHAGSHQCILQCGYQIHGFNNGGQQSGIKGQYSKTPGCHDRSLACFRTHMLLGHWPIHDTKFDGIVCMVNSRNLPPNRFMPFCMYGELRVLFSALTLMTLTDSTMPDSRHSDDSHRG